jgi:hypothetical protein
MREKENQARVGRELGTNKKGRWAERERERIGPGRGLGFENQTFFTKKSPCSLRFKFKLNR